MPSAEPSKVSPRFTFDNFFVHNSNRTAFDAARSMAAGNSTCPSPLVIFGGAGTGKTHLLHAIGNALRLSNSRTFYRTSEDFVNGAINAYKSKQLERFELHLQHIDSLLLDDLQFLEEKPCAQQQFLKMLDDLCLSGKRLVLTSDRTPSALKFSNRLCDRIEGGLVLEVQYPEKDLKLLIVEARALEKDISIPPQAADYLAEVSSTIRELEGAVNKIAAYSQSVRTSLDSEQIQNLIGKEVRRTELTIHMILKQVATVSGFSIESIRAKNNTAPIVRARSITMYLASRLADCSYSEIGRFFAKHHTTVLHSVRKLQNERQADGTLDAQIIQLEKQLKA